MSRRDDPSIESSRASARRHSRSRSRRSGPVIGGCRLGRSMLRPAGRRVGMAAVAGLAAVAASATLIAVSEAGPGDLAPDLVTMAIGDDDLRIGPSAARSCCGSRTRSATAATGRSRSSRARHRRAVTATATPTTTATRPSASSPTRTGPGPTSAGSTRSPPSGASAACATTPPTITGTCSTSPPTSFAASAAAGSCCARARSASASPTRAPAFESAATPLATTYPINPPGIMGCQSISTQGISAGWADAYVLTLPGQSLDVTELPRGSYCLTTRADPTGMSRRARRAQQRPPGAAGAPARGAERAQAARAAAEPRAGRPSALRGSAPPRPARRRRSQCASGEGGVSRRYHSASSAPMQPVPAAVTAWR